MTLTRRKREAPAIGGRLTRRVNKKQAGGEFSLPFRKTPDDKLAALKREKEKRAKNEEKKRLEQEVEKQKKDFKEQVKIDKKKEIYEEEGLGTRRKRWPWNPSISKGIKKTYNKFKESHKKFKDFLSNHPELDTGGTDDKIKVQEGEFFTNHIAIRILNHKRTNLGITYHHCYLVHQEILKNLEHLYEIVDQFIDKLVSAGIFFSF